MKTKSELRPGPGRSALLRALAFQKSWSDPFVGHVTVHPRVFRRAESPEVYVLNPGKGTRGRRISRLLQMHANKARKRLNEIYAGDICACVGLKERQYRRHALRRKQADHPGKYRFPDTGYFRGHRAKDESRPGQTGLWRLQRLAQEDPTVPRFHRTGHRADAHLPAWGELHL